MFLAGHEFEQYFETFEMIKAIKQTVLNDKSKKVRFQVLGPE